jgi:hypothetical protein
VLGWLVAAIMASSRCRVGLRFAVVIAVAACMPAHRTVGEWRLVETCLTPIARVTPRGAWLLAERALRAPDPVGRARDLAGVHRDAAVLACGLREAHHEQAWSHHGDGRHDVWLVSFRRADRLVALAAIDADRGALLALTYGAWESSRHERPDEPILTTRMRGL